MTSPGPVAATGYASASSLAAAMRLLQFGDSMLPVGSFAFSNALESAVEQGVVHDVATLRRVRGHGHAPGGDRAMGWPCCTPIAPTCRG